MSEKELQEAFLRNGGVITVCDNVSSLGYINKSGKLADSYGENYVSSIPKLNGRTASKNKIKKCRCCNEEFIPTKKPFSTVYYNKCFRCRGADKITIEKVNRAGGWDKYAEVLKMKKELLPLAWSMNSRYPTYKIEKVYNTLKTLKVVENTNIYNKRIARFERYLDIDQDDRVKPFRSESDFDF